MRKNRTEIQNASGRLLRHELPYSGTVGEKHRSGIQIERLSPTFIRDLVQRPVPHARPLPPAT